MKFQNVTSFDHYKNTIEADKSNLYIEKAFYRESGTYIKYFILTNTYIFVDSKSTHTLEKLIVF